ncbi:type VI secretion system amidase effector protein Tae4 [Sansalvadorimonas sp. 2012CJ34-2]|uniref:Type VI secretion system amidase effector protein Tae4 n=1 Tax=Parendozoicomonas callyspongiae TaxID=2942213 RepID=A0ABT0PM20_9GAMM|nr:type VI secretion system amidase effector protein Tae4 [Sansalvadorimonas sp. 2012CJ34-2]MCL6272301.1 type VI secretion system amidase effector protein Tae4 [Sansalvadorimonas sp. 2012CJ34-2]
MITFKKLWNSHPTITGSDNPCTTNGKKNFSNQCSIRVGVALVECGVKTTDIPGVTHCWHGHPKSAGHVIRAEELANGLQKVSLPGLKPVIEVDPKEFSEQLSGKKGIIFFKDYWQRTVRGKTESFRNRSGDHIDIWNGSRITDLTSWARINLRIGSFGLHSITDRFSDFEDSQKILFWEITQ